MLITAPLIALAYSNFDAHARTLQRLVNTGALAPAPAQNRLRKATSFRWASMVGLFVTALILVTACCFVWLHPR